jgi:hypothetical protein
MLNKLHKTALRISSIALWYSPVPVLFVSGMVCLDLAPGENNSSFQALGKHKHRLQSIKASNQKAHCTNYIEESHSLQRHSLKFI